MLPSGNDAAQTIADYFDKVIKEKMDKVKEKTENDITRR